MPHLFVYTYGKMEPYDNIQTRFGMELEICIRVGDTCLSSPKNVSDMVFQDRFELYFKDILAKCDPTFLELHTEIAIEDDMSVWYIYNLVRPFVDGKPNSRLVEKDSEEYEKISLYQIPLFVFDFSVSCGDDKFVTSNTFNENMQKPIELNKSITMECITPVLTVIGEPTKEKIDGALRPYLNFFGLRRPECFIVNHTAGCHVNVSVYDTKKDEVLRITERPLFLSILDTYIPMEREVYYNQFRERQPHFLPPKPPLNYVFAKPIYKAHNQILARKNLSKNKKEEAMATSFFAKNYAIRRKVDLNVLEFRVFQSEKDIDLLIRNALIATYIVYDGVTKSMTGGGYKKVDTSRGHTYRKQRNNKYETVYLRNATRRRKQRVHS